MDRCYVTTAIPYVNAAPHLGHALELVQADVLARHGRLRGHPTRLLTGTDDNALKNLTAARAAGVEVGEFVAAHAARFDALRDTLDLAVDDVIHTATDPRHAPGVAALWRRSAARDDFYRRSWTGWYCPGCEEFRDGPAPCPEHGPVVEEVRETNWFFRLSRYAPRIEEVIASGQVRIEPATRRNEVLSFLRSGVADISVSRPAARAPGWGIPVPDDPDQVVYVWWDALANYVTALGVPAPGVDGPGLDRWWSGSARRVHVIGKGILRFHAVHWLGLLLSAGLPLPTDVLVHPYLTVGGRKISKSAGPAVDPAAVVADHGVDALRWWFAREAGREADTDFTADRLADRAERELVGGLGNLVHRTVTLVHRLRDGRVPGAAGDLLPVAAVPPAVDAGLARFDLRAATDAIVGLVGAGNRLVERERPWAQTDAARLDEVLASLVRAGRVLAREAAPFVPAGAARLAAELGGGDRVGPSTAAFPRRAGPVRSTRGPRPGPHDRRPPAPPPR